jgi:Rieske Fe-S protein
VLVVTFDPNQFNFIVAGEESYFLLRLHDGSRLLFNDRCAHRGGPLHLGDWNDAGSCLVCPWHQSKYSEKVLRKQAVPLVYSQGRATVMLDAASTAPISLIKKTILAQPCSQAHKK